MSKPNEKRQKRICMNCGGDHPEVLHATIATQPQPTQGEDSLLYAETTYCTRCGLNVYRDRQGHHDTCCNSENDLIAERDALQAQRDELLAVLRDCFTSDGATAFVHPRYAPQRLRAINELVQGAIARAVQAQAAIARATEGGTGQ